MGLFDFFTRRGKPQQPASANAGGRSINLRPVASAAASNGAFAHLLVALLFKDSDSLMTLLSLHAYPKQATDRVRQIWEGCYAQDPTQTSEAKRLAHQVTWASTFVAQFPTAVITLVPAEPGTTATRFLGMVFNLRMAEGQITVEDPFALCFTLESGGDAGATIVEHAKNEPPRTVASEIAGNTRDDFLRGIEDRVVGKFGPSSLSAEQFKMLEQTVVE